MIQVKTTSYLVPRPRFMTLDPISLSLLKGLDKQGLITARSKTMVIDGVR